MERVFQLRQSPPEATDARSVVLLGATGSIGASTAEIIKGAGGAFSVAAVAGGHDGKALAAVARELGAKFAAVADFARLR